MLNNEKSKRIINAVILSVAIISLAENFRLGASKAKIDNDNLSIENVVVEEQTGEEKWNSFLDSNHYYADFYELQELPIDKVTYTKEEITSLIAKGECHKIVVNDYWVKDDTETKDGITNLIYVRYEPTTDKYFGIGTKSVKTEDLDVFLIKNSSMKGGNPSYTSEEIEAFLLAGKATFDESEKCFYVNVGGSFVRGDITCVVPMGYSLMFKYVYDGNTKTYVKTNSYYQVKNSQGIEKTRRQTIWF